jgi:hypothetical protein
MRYEGYEAMEYQEQILIMEKEEIKIVKKESRLLQSCNACHVKSKIVYHLLVGDTDLIKLCPDCLKRLRRCKVNARRNL